MPKDHSATGSHAGGAAPELLLKLSLVFNTLFRVHISIFGVFGAMLLLVLSPLLGLPTDLTDRFAKSLPGLCCYTSLPSAV